MLVAIPLGGFLLIVGLGTLRMFYALFFDDDFSISSNRLFWFFLIIEIMLSITLYLFLRLLLIT